MQVTKYSREIFFSNGVHSNPRAYVGSFREPPGIFLRESGNQVPNFSIRDFCPEDYKSMMDHCHCLFTQVFSNYRADDKLYESVRRKHA